MDQAQNTQIKLDKAAPLSSVRELLTASWQILHQKIRIVIMVLLLSLLASFLVAILLELVNSIFANLPNLIIVEHVVVLALFMLLVYLAIMINIIVYLVLGKNINNIKESWRMSNKYFLSFAMTMFWLVVVFFIWLLITNDILIVLSTIPVFLALIFYSVVAWVFFIEDYHGQSALRRAMEIIKGYWIALILRCLFLLLPLLIFVLLVGLIKNAQIVSVLMSMFYYFYGIFVLIYTHQIYNNLIKIKGDSRLERGKYSSLFYVGSVVVYILMLVSLYVLVV